MMKQKKKRKKKKTKTTKKKKTITTLPTYELRPRNQSRIEYKSTYKHRNVAAGYNQERIKSL